MAMVNVVLNGKLQQLTQVTNKNRFISYLARLIMSCRSTTLLHLVEIVSAVAPPRGGKISGSRAFHYYFLFVFSFLATRTAQTREPIFTHNSSKDAVRRKEVSSKQVLFEILTFWSPFPPKPHKFRRQ